MARLGTCFDPNQEFVNTLIRYLCEQQSVTPLLETPDQVEVTRRSKDGKEFTFVLNHNPEPVEVDLGDDGFINLLTKEEMTGKVTLAGRDLLILANK